MTLRVTAYSGRSVQSRREPIVYRCPCGERFSAEVWRAISSDEVGSPDDHGPASEQRRRLIEGDLNRVRCPRCDASVDVQVSVLLHEVGKRLVLVAPPSERHRELALIAELFALLATDGVPAEDYVLQARVVFGSSGLVELLARNASVVVPLQSVRTEILELQDFPDAPAHAPATDKPSIADAPIPDAPMRMATAPDLDAVLAAAREQRRKTDPTLSVVRVETEGEPSPGLAPVAEVRENTQPRITVSVPDPRTAVIERWIAARETATALFVDDRVVVCASLPAATLEHFVASSADPAHKGGARVALRPQLHRMTSFPLLVLTFVAGEDTERPDEARIIHVPLDLTRAAHRVALDQLQRRCAIELELFDSEYLPVVSLNVTVPLEDHLRHLVAEAKVAIDRLPVTTRSFERARAAFLGAGYDRLGRTAIDLPTLEDIVHATPTGIRTALQAVARWNEPAAESYLLEIRGFPLKMWRRIASSTVRRAIEIGLFVPRGLAERVARRSEDGLDLPPWTELIEIEIRRFAELSARLRPSDLSPADEAANWEQLLREGDANGIAIDDAVQKLADAAFARVGGRPSKRARPGRVMSSRSSQTLPAISSANAGSDLFAGVSAAAKLSEVPTDELLPLLEDREQRLAAATALAARREQPTLPAIFAALRRMSRPEANALLPRLPSFGPSAERWLIEGLRSKKAFMRQGCALALGRLGTPLAIDALVRLLFDEPTEIWTEIARALGDIGAPAVMPLAARLREVEGDARERIVHALAHIAARAADGGGAENRSAVDALANGRDALVANAARRALVLAPEVRNAHLAVRSERREQTLVRAFTRRFYDAINGGTTEGPDDLGELDSAEFETITDDEEDEDELSDVELSALEVRERSQVSARVRDQPTLSPAHLAPLVRRPPSRS